MLTNDKMIEMAKDAVVEYFNSNADITDKNGKITRDDVFVVWFCKTLQHFKALVSTTVSDGMYYEYTFNGDKNEAYLDAYKKWKNKAIKYADNEEDERVVVMDLNATIELMTSDDYKERFKAEYHQTNIRYKKLLNMIKKAEAGTLDFTLDCPLSLLKKQSSVMANYLTLLDKRARIEGVDLSV